MGYNSASPSPEIGRTNAIQDIPVNLYTGTPQINIPLSGFKEGRVGINLGLNYNPATIRTHALSGWTGLGWELSGIPTLSRIVRGFPDEGSLNNNAGRKGYYFYGTSLPNSDITQDKEPDIFFLNTPTGTFKFMFDRYKRPHFFPEADIKVDVSWVNNPNESGSNHYARKFTEFKFTMPDGSKLYFPIANVEETAEVEVKTAQSNGYYPLGSNFISFLNNSLLASGWNCSKIESPYGETINFEYDRIAYTYYKLAEDEEEGNCPGTVSRKINKVYVRGAQISQIYSPHIKIVFNAGLESCTTDYSVFPPETVCTITGGVRNDIDSWGNAPTDQSASKILLSMRVSDNEASPTVYSTFTFNYGYFNGDDDQALPSGYVSGDVGTTHKRRLKLSSISMPDNTTYTFSYLNEMETLASRFNYGVDHWGYSNGKLANTKGLIGADYLNANAGCSSDRSVDFTYARGHVLSKIAHSSGSETLFTYEANRARNYSGDVGGLRIKEIEYKDLIRGQQTKKSYEYLNAAGTASSGFVFVKPIYRISQTSNYFIHSDLFGSLLAESGRPIVGYGRVTEKTSSSDNSIQTGKIVRIFEQDETEASIKTDPSCPAFCDYNPTHFNLKHDFGLGQLLRQEVYNQSNDTLQILDYDHTAGGGIKYDSTFAQKFYHQTLSNGYFVTTKSYYQVFRKYRPEGQQSKQFSRDGTGTPVIRQVDITYKDEMPAAYRNTYRGRHNMPVKTSTTDEAGTSIETLTKYTADFNFDSYTVQVCDPDCNGDPIHSCPHPACYHDSTVTIVPPSSYEARGIFESIEKHLYDYRVESLVKMNDQAVQATYQTYYPANSAFNTLPNSTYVLRNAPKAGFQEVTYNESNYLMDRDGDYGTARAATLGYNGKGMPLTSDIKRGATAARAYDAAGTLPLGSTSNAGKGDALTRTVEYDKVFQGVSKEVSPDGMERRYEYQNGTNRLLTVRDHNNRVIATREYNVNAGTPVSNLAWDSGQRSKACSGGQVSLTVGVSGLLPGSTVEFSTNGGTSWQAANTGTIGYTLTMTPTNNYQNFKARASDSPSAVISQDYHASCTTSPPLAWSTNSCTYNAGNSEFFVSVSGLATDSHAEFSIDNVNWYRANVGDSGYNVSVPYGAGGLQEFWHRAAEDHAQGNYGVLTKCN
ncbi:hypothetical protein LAG90_09260 [Marinilongibacter aquaticus]|uniref:hypothetical protein n=1 Tax=Marinilongibacter aquaticus TaxID=2975157 RepID=UPI0021BDB2D7|nr:hypothetical protein [Marinilongibacter aquaticus]UBM60823.1 hypothetical protein LAG90_09260 [Marinilongibacter aquaticus]